MGFAVISVLAISAMVGEMFEGLRRVRDQRMEAEVSEKNRSKQAFHIRWMIRRDMPEVLEIEKASFEFPWSEEDFIRCLRQRNCIGMVVEHQARVVGFMLYELHKNKLHVLNFVVRPDVRRRGVGTQMVEKLKSRLSQHRRNRVCLEIRETSLAAQVFFKNADFLAVSVLRDYYDDTTEDAYVFQYQYGQKPMFANSVRKTVLK